MNEYSFYLQRDPRNIISQEIQQKAILVKQLIDPEFNQPPRLHLNSNKILKDIMLKEAQRLSMLEEKIFAEAPEDWKKLLAEYAVLFNSIHSFIVKLPFTESSSFEKFLSLIKGYQKKFNEFFTQLKRLNERLQALELKSQKNLAKENSQKSRNVPPKEKPPTPPIAETIFVQTDFDAVEVTQLVAIEHDYKEMSKKIKPSKIEENDQKVILGAQLESLKEEFTVHSTKKDKKDRIDAKLQIPFHEIRIHKKFSDMSSGAVFEGEFRRQKVWIQKCDNSISPQEEAQLFNHVQSLSALRCDYIANIYGVYWGKDFKCVVVENFAKGSVNDYLMTDEPDIKISLNQCLQIIYGIYNIHCRGIIHGGLNGQTTFINQNDILKLGNFTHASRSQDAQSSPVDMTVINTQWPVNDGNSNSSSAGEKTSASLKDDMYSLGIVLWQLLTGLNPEKDFNPVEAFKGLPQPLAALLQQLIETKKYSDLMENAFLIEDVIVAFEDPAFQKCILEWDRKAWLENKAKQNDPEAQFKLVLNRCRKTKSSIEESKKALSESRIVLQKISKNFPNTIHAAKAYLIEVIISLEAYASATEEKDKESNYQSAKLAFQNLKKEKAYSLLKETYSLAVINIYNTLTDIHRMREQDRKTSTTGLTYGLSSSLLPPPPGQIRNISQNINPPPSSSSSMSFGLNKGDKQ